MCENGLLRQIQVIDSLSQNFLFGINNIDDYNEDKFNDITIMYGTGARGSIMLNYLFIQNKESSGNVSFKYIRGSDYPPNLYFDSSRNVITSTMFHGGVTFVDYKVVDDSLIELGSVEVTGDDRWVIRVYSVIDSFGNSIEVNRDSVLDGWDEFYSQDIYHK